MTQMAADGESDSLCSRTEGMEEMRRKSIGETSGNALIMESRRSQNERGRSPGNHGKSKKGRSKSRFRKIECWNYGKKGHLKKYCRAPKKKGDKQQENTQEANVVDDVLQDALILALDNTSDYWVVYSRASFHDTRHRKFFHDYVQGDFRHVLLGDDEPCKIVGKGKVRIKLNNGNDWLLKDVRHIPAMKRNLISTR